MRKAGSMVKKIGWSVFLAAAVFMVSDRPVFALNFFELEVYPYDTAGQGEVELESQNNYVVNGEREADPGKVPNHHLWRTSLEAVYGVTDHLEAAAYLDLALTPDG